MDQVFSLQRSLLFAQFRSRLPFGGKHKIGWCRVSLKTLPQVFDVYFSSYNGTVEDLSSLDPIFGDRWYQRVKVLHDVQQCPFPHDCTHKEVVQISAPLRIKWKPSTSTITFSFKVSETLSDGSIH